MIKCGEADASFQILSLLLIVLFYNTQYLYLSIIWNTKLITMLIEIIFPSTDS